MNLKFLIFLVCVYFSSGTRFLPTIIWDFDGTLGGNVYFDLYDKITFLCSTHFLRSSFIDGYTRSKEDLSFSLYRGTFCNVGNSSLVLECDGSYKYTEINFKPAQYSYGNYSFYTYRSGVCSQKLLVSLGKFGYIYDSALLRHNLAVNTVDSDAYPNTTTVGEDTGCEYDIFLLVSTIISIVLLAVFLIINALMYIDSYLSSKVKIKTKMTTAV